jgi:hypothetical protein
MTVLAPRKPLETKEPEITVDELPVGTHVIRLVVVDDEGNASDPFDVTVEVTERGRIPVITRPPDIVETRLSPGDPVIRVPVTPVTPIAAPSDVRAVRPPAKTTRPAKTQPVKPAKRKPKPKPGDTT